MQNKDALIKIYQKAAVDNNIPAELYTIYNVKKGLRNENKTGVLVGLTRICDVVGYEMRDGQKVDIPGQLFYRGIEIKDFVANCQIKPGAFEEVCFLLLFGKLPNESEYLNFCDYLKANYPLPKEFIDVNILRLPAFNLLNKIQRALLMLYDYDTSADDISGENTLLQGLNILAKLPALAIYSYFGMLSAKNGQPLELPLPNPKLTMAENLLSLIRNNQAYSKTEAEVLDVIMALHADHGGGNNSTFANIVVSSTDTDLYSCLATAVGSLKGPKHGGANERVVAMMNDAINQLGYTPSDEALADYLGKLLDKQAFDKSGLIYGIGHAIYTVSDPRAEILYEYCQKLALTSENQVKLAFYRNFEKAAVAYLKNNKQADFCINVDFYSGLAYEMLNIPKELFLPIFVISRVVGWLAHNLENKLYCHKIIRPATKYIGEYLTYQDLKAGKK